MLILLPIHRFFSSTGFVLNYAPYPFLILCNISNNRVSGPLKVVGLPLNSQGLGILALLGISFDCPMPQFPNTMIVSASTCIYPIRVVALYFGILLGAAIFFGAILIVFKLLATFTKLSACAMWALTFFSIYNDMRLLITIGTEILSEQAPCDLMNARGVYLSSMDFTGQFSCESQSFDTVRGCTCENNPTQSCYYTTEYHVATIVAPSSRQAFSEFIAMCIAQNLVTAPNTQKNLKLFANLCSTVDRCTFSSSTDSCVSMFDDSPPNKRFFVVLCLAFALVGLKAGFEIVKVLYRYFCLMYTPLAMLCECFPALCECFPACCSVCTSYRFCSLQRLCYHVN